MDVARPCDLAQNPLLRCTLPLGRQAQWHDYQGLRFGRRRLPALTPGYIDPRLRRYLRRSEYRNVRETMDYSKDLRVLIPSDFIREASVVGFRCRIAAAPSGP